MKALCEREMFGCGPNGRITLYDNGTVEIVNDLGVSSARFDSGTAMLHAFWHPFADESYGLTIPGARTREGIRPLTDEEYILAELLDEEEVAA